MAASAAELERLIEGYQEGLTRLAGATETAAEHRWVRSGSLGRRAITEALDDLEVITRAGRDASTRLAASFVDSYVAAATGTTPPVDPINIDELLDRAPSPRPAFRRIAGDAAVARRGGLAATEALEATAPAMGTVADAHVAYGARDGFTAAMARHPQIVGYRRHPEPTACKFCLQISTRTYRRSDLRPVHTHCHCVTIPIFGSTADGVPEARTPTPVDSATKAASETVDIPSGSKSGSARGMRAALEAIERRHRVPADMPRIPFVTKTAPKYLGHFRHIEGSSFRQARAVEIAVRAKADQAPLTGAHEFGHFLDWSGLGNGQGSFSSEHWHVRTPVRGAGIVRELRDDTPSHWRAFWDTIDASPAFDRLESSTKRPQVKSYYRRPREIWARAYSQWIAEGDETLQTALKAFSTADGVQWTTEEFRPIGQAIQGILKAEGLME